MCIYLYYVYISFRGTWARVYGPGPEQENEIQNFGQALDLANIFEKFKGLTVFFFPESDERRGLVV